MFSTLTLLGGISDTGDSTPSSVDIGLFDNTLAGEDPANKITTHIMVSIS
jgi:hypothetical protein